MSEFATPEQRASELIALCKEFGYEQSEHGSLNDFIKNSFEVCTVLRQTLTELTLGLTLGTGAIAPTHDGSGTLLISASARIPSSVKYSVTVNRSDEGYTIVAAKIDRPETALAKSEIDELEKQSQKEPQLIQVPGGRA